MDGVRFAGGHKHVCVFDLRPCRLRDLGLILETMQLWLPLVLQQERKVTISLACLVQFLQLRAAIVRLDHMNDQEQKRRSWRATTDCTGPFLAPASGVGVRRDHKANSHVE